MFKPTFSSPYFLGINLLNWFLVLNFNTLHGEQLLHACKESEYHYEYTECDSKGTRWRVAVPHNPGLCTGLPDPVKGTDCSFSCSAGQYLDMALQECTPCTEGTYSLGTGVRFDEWTELPPGFTSISSNIYVPSGNCNMSQWKACGDYVASNTDECSSTLMYSINLKQEGTLSFEYLYPDSNIAFEFFVHNDQCQPIEEESRWMRTTENGWSVHQVKLTQGTNVLYWKTRVFYLGGSTPKSVLLRNILITGAAYTSECFQCKPGTFAPTKGAPFCQICPRNTYSTRGATYCTQCESDKYSVPGSGSCVLRPPCTEKDYFYTHTPCDSSGETHLMYKWIEPKICSNSVAGAKELPESGVKKKCPPCNPGFYSKNTSHCEPCPKDTFSNGTVCKLCPAGTEAVLGYEYKWWNTLPENMQSLVMSGLSFDYQNESGWEVAGDYIYSSAASADNDYMILRLHIPGFSPPHQITDDSEINEIAHVTFVFDLKCTVGCQFFFMIAVNGEISSLIESWTGPREKQLYSYRVERNANTTFTWAFQRTSDQSNGVHGRKYTADIAKIYSINVTNTKDGVASWCRPCAQGKDSQCISCPPGHYIDKSTNKCTSCPDSTYLQSHLPFGEETCTPCGTGTKSNDAHSLCFNDCKIAVTTGGGKLMYDFTLLSNLTTFKGPPRFTNKGLKYYHQFSISLCGNQGRKMATCVQNDTWGSDMELWRSVSSYVCQSMFVPSDTLANKGMMSSQPINLADQLIGVTTETTLDSISSPSAYFPGENIAIKDIIFYYRSKEVTKSCTSGRSTTVRLRCNPQKSGLQNIYAPSNCPEGTCDGCSFHFLWETKQACPLCTVYDYHIITSVCEHGLQRTTALWHMPRLCVGGVELPKPTVSICKTEYFWLKVGVTSGICSALILTALTGYFWKKNRNLEYKYSRLMMNTSSKDEGLPAADSCAIMEGEDAEDELIFNNRHSILRKFMSLSRKRTLDGFDSVPLKSSDGSHMDM